MCIEYIRGYRSYIRPESLLAECCASVIISSDASSAVPFMGKYDKHSLDTNGRIIFKQDNGNNYLYVNANEDWIVSSFFTS